MICSRISRWQGTVPWHEQDPDLPLRPALRLVLWRQPGTGQHRRKHRGWTGTSAHRPVCRSRRTPHGHESGQPRLDQRPAHRGDHRPDLQPDLPRPGAVQSPPAHGQHRRHAGSHRRGPDPAPAGIRGAAAHPARTLRGWLQHHRAGHPVRIAAWPRTVRCSYAAAGGHPRTARRHQPAHRPGLHAHERAVGPWRARLRHPGRRRAAPAALQHAVLAAHALCAPGVRHSPGRAGQPAQT